jgi:phenylacetate-coenzyme A ligase PaaK-like adenylate-forming protein
MSAAVADTGHDPTPDELLARDAWSRERLVACQEERLRSLVEFAVARSPYYRDALGRDAADAPLAQLPTLPKATLMEELDRIVTDPRLRRRDLERHARGPAAGDLLHGDFRVFATSGTTGLHGLVVYSQREFAQWVAAALRAIRRTGARPGPRLAAIGAPHPLHVTQQLFASFRGGAVSPLSVTTPLHELVEALNELRPETIATYPSIAAALADAQLAGRLRIAPDRVIVGSEVLTDDAEHRMLAAWGIRPFNVYAATEAPMIAITFPGRSGLHVADDFVVVESVDAEGAPVPTGTPGAKVLLTNLVNRAQPLIRYELSDSIILATESSAAPYSVIERVDGRSDDILRVAGVDGGEVALHPYLLREPFAALPEVRQYQIVLDRERLSARVVLGRGAGADLLPRLLETLERVVARAGARVPVAVVPVQTIEREAGHAAKIKLVKDLR